MALRRVCGGPRVVCVLLLSNAILLLLLFRKHSVTFSSAEVVGRTNVVHVDNDIISDKQMLEDMIAWSLRPYSICYIFNQNHSIENDERLALVSVSDIAAYPHPNSWPFLSRFNKLKYANTFSYDYCEFPRDMDFTTLREVRWVKFGVLYTMLLQYKYVVWLDTDTIFWNKPYISFHQNALKHFSDNANLSVLFSNHGKHEEPTLINSGVFVVKHSPFAFNFLETIYVDYVNKNLTHNHADQDAFQDFMKHRTNVSESNNEIMIVPSSELQRIYVQAKPNQFADDYKRLYTKQGETIVLHRVSGKAKKYYQLNDILKVWIDQDVLTRIRNLCGSCFDDEDVDWMDGIRKTKINMNAHTRQRGNKLLRYP